MPDLDALVSAAARAAARGDEEGVLLALLEAWPSHRAAPLAEAVLSLSGRFLRRHPLIETQKDWHALAQRRDPLSVTALLAAPSTERLSALTSKLTALGAFPPDPRLALHGQQIAAQLRYVRSPGRDKAFSAAEALARRHGPLQEPVTDERLHALCEAAASLGPSIEDRLLAAIHASPEDDAPRLVYADWLLEQDDLVGARIIRAVSGALEHELQQLHPLHHTRWLRHHLGPLPPDAVEFRRGLPVRVTLQQGPLPTFTPGWASVEEIDLLEPSGQVLRQLPSLRQLPRLRLLGLRHNEAQPSWLALVQPLLQELDLPELCLWKASWAQALTEPWPALHRLWLTVWHEPVPLDEASLGQLAARPLDVGLWSPHHGVGQLLAKALVSVPTAAPAIRRLRFQRPSRAEPSIDPRLQVTLERDEAGALRRLRMAGLTPHNLDQLWRVVGACAPGSFSEIVVASAFAQDEAFRRPLQRALAPFKGTPLTLQPLSS